MPEPRSPWQRFKDELWDSAAHGSIIGVRGLRSGLEYLIEGDTDDTTRKALEHKRRAQKGREQDAIAFEDVDTLSPANIGKHAVDLIGNVVGGVDPTYPISFGKNLVTRIATQAGINAGVDAANQGVDIARGEQKRFDPRRTAINAAAGAVVQGGFEGGRALGTGRRIRRGSARPEFAKLEQTMLALEGGGTLANPKVSPKGAKGPYQVMDATARDPGFGIRPWDGKSEADRARVGRQYLATMTDRYDGDAAKILAAYNAGPGAVDKWIKKYGDDWIDNIPFEETRKYVRNGLNKLGVDNVSPLRGNPKRVFDQNRAINELREADKAYDEGRISSEEYDRILNDVEGRGLNAFDPDQVSNPYVDDALRQADDSDNVTPFPTERVDYSEQDIVDNLGRLERGEITLDDFNKIAEQFYGPLSPEMKAHIFRGENTTDPMDRYKPRVERGDDVLTPAERQDMDASVPTVPRGNTGYEKFTPPAKPKAPANDTRVHAEKGAKDYTDQEWARLTNEQKQAALNLDRDRTIREVKPDLPSPEAVQIARRIGAKSLDSLTPEEWARLEKLTPEQIAKAEADVKKGRSFRRIVKDLWDDESGSYRDRPEEVDKAWEDLSAEEKLIKAVRRMKPISAESRKLQHEERSRRFARVAAIQSEGGGEAGFYQEKSALKGQLPRPEYESIAKNFTQADRDELLNRIKFSNSLLPGEKTTAQDALLKLLGGEGAKTPTARDLRLLSEVFSPDFVETMMKHRPLAEKVWNNTVSAMNVPRALMATADVSAPFRQGIFLIGRKEFWTSFKPMFKVLFSEANSKELIGEIKSRDTYKLMREGGLAITDPHNHFLLDNEEDFMTDLAEKIPIWGEVVKASNRAYSGFLNRLRADYFDHLLLKYEDAGINLGADTARLKGLARFINSATGRGDLGKYNAAAPALNAIFFSPRLIKARFDMLLNPATYLRQDKIVRVEAWKNLRNLGGVAIGVASLAALGGMEVETDPRSSDFFKPKNGNTRYDILGGFQQFIRLGAQLATNEKKTMKGEVVDLFGGRNLNNEGRTPLDESLYDVLHRFFRSKFNPALGFAANASDGENVIGEDFNRTKEIFGFEVPEEVMNLFIAMSLSDIAEAFGEEGVVGGVKALPASFGTGVQTYEPKEPKPKKSKSTRSKADKGSWEQ